MEQTWTLTKSLHSKLKSDRSGMGIVLGITTVEKKKKYERITGQTDDKIKPTTIKQRQRSGHICERKRQQMDESSGRSGGDGCKTIQARPFTGRGDEIRKLTELSRQN